MLALGLWWAWERRWSFSWELPLAAVAMVGGLAALYRGLAWGPVRVVAPVSTLGAGVPVVYGVILGERLAPDQAIGVLAALLGLTLVARGEVQHEGGGNRLGPALLHGLGAAVGLGSAVALLGIAGREAPLWSVAVVRLLAAALAGTVAGLTAVRGEGLARARWHSAVWLLVAASLLDTMANLSFVLAAMRGALGLSGLLASLYPVTTVVLGRIVLGERWNRRQVGGLFLVFAGVVVLER